MNKVEIINRQYNSRETLTTQEVILGTTSSISFKNPKNQETQAIKATANMAPTPKDTLVKAPKEDSLITPNNSKTTTTLINHPSINLNSQITKWTKSTKKFSNF